MCILALRASTFSTWRVCQRLSGGFIMIAKTMMRYCLPASCMHMHTVRRRVKTFFSMSLASLISQRLAFQLMKRPMKASNTRISWMSSTTEIPMPWAFDQYHLRHHHLLLILLPHRRLQCEIGCCEEEYANFTFLIGISTCMHTTFSK
jgi:hypothetical protein